MLSLIIAIALVADPTLDTTQKGVAAATSSTQSQKDVEQITQLLNDQYAAWNRRDLDGYLFPLWKSPTLLYVSEGQVSQGWQEVKARMERNYPDRAGMGLVIPDRFQVNRISEDIATCIEWWSMRFSKANVHGISTSSWRKFPEGWRIIEVQSSCSEFSD